MAPHSSTLAWKIPCMEEPGGLQSMGSQRVGYDCATSLSLFTVMNWRRKWQPTPVFLPGESQERGSLVGCRLSDRRVGLDWNDLAAAVPLVQNMEKKNISKELLIIRTKCCFNHVWHVAAIACWAPLSMRFSGQKYGSGLPCPSPGDLLDPGIEVASLMSLALAGVIFTTSITSEA